MDIFAPWKVTADIHHQALTPGAWTRSERQNLPNKTCCSLGSICQLLLFFYCGNSLEMLKCPNQLQTHCHSKVRHVL